MLKLLPEQNNYIWFVIPWIYHSGNAGSVSEKRPGYFKRYYE